MGYNTQTAKVLDTPWLALTTTPCQEVVMAHAIISRKEALTQGLTRYFTGKPCKRGHVADRCVKREACLECLPELEEAARVRARAWGAANKERAQAKARAYWSANYEAVCARNNAYGKANRHKSREASRRYREKHREKCAERSRARKAANREAMRAAGRAYVAANREKCRAAGRAYVAANKELCAAKRKAWAAANPDKLRAKDHRRRARKHAAEGHHTPADITRIYETQCGKCAYCKKNVGKKFHIDHIQPLSKGGSNWPANLQVLCGPCNIAKSARDPIEFAQSLGLLL